jgi:hypothetical protein
VSVSHIVPERWLEERDDRADLALWLTRSAPILRSAFLNRARQVFLETGRLPDGMEHPVRNARSRADRERARETWQHPNPPRRRKAQLAEARA